MFLLNQLLEELKIHVIKSCWFKENLIFVKVVPRPIWKKRKKNTQQLKSTWKKEEKIKAEKNKEIIKWIKKIIKK